MTYPRYKGITEGIDSSIKTLDDFNAKQRPPIRIKRSWEGQVSPLPDEGRFSSAAPLDRSHAEDQGDGPNMWDTFRLGGTRLIHRSKQYFTSTLPQFMFPEVQPGQSKVTGMSDEKARQLGYGYSPEEAGVSNQKTKGTRDYFKRQYLKNETRHQSWLKEHPELQPKPEYTEDITQNLHLLKDPGFWGWAIADAASFSLGVMGTTIGTAAITKNPVLGLAAGTAVATPSQSQDLFEDLKASGASEGQAAQLAVPIGMAIALVESITDLPLLKALNPAFDIFRRNIQQSLVKATMGQIVKKGVKTFAAVEAAEVVEEVFQGAIHNATVKTFDENRQVFENVDETIIRTLVSTSPFAIFGGGKASFDYASNANKLEKAGFSPQEARMKALNEAAKTPEGAKMIADTVTALRTATNQLPEDAPGRQGLGGATPGRQGLEGNISVGVHVGETLVSAERYNELSPEKKSELRRLQAEYNAIGVVRPSLELGPDQTRRMSQKEKDKVSSNLVKGFDVERRIRGVLQTDVEKNAQDVARQLRDIDGRVSQLRRHIEDLESVYRKKLDSPRPNNVKFDYEQSQSELKGLLAKKKALTEEPAPPPTMAPSTSVQTGLPGLEQPVQAKAFEEFGGAPGTAGQKAPLIEVPKKSTALPGQEALPQPTTQAVTPVPAAPVAETGTQPPVTTKAAPKTAKKPEAEVPEGILESLKKPEVTEDVTQTVTQEPSRTLDRDIEAQVKAARGGPTKPPISEPPIKLSEPEPGESFRRMPAIQDAQTILEVNMKPDRKRYLAQLPGIKQALKRLNPSAVANTAAERFLIIRAVGRDQGSQRSQAVMSQLLRLGDSAKVFGKLSDAGIITKGKFKGLSVNRIAEDFNEFGSVLTKAQKEWLNTANDIQKAIIDYADRMDIPIEELVMGPGKRFASRRVLGRVNEQGEIDEVAFIGAGPGRVGGKISAQKHRSYKSIKEAEKDGFRYLPYDIALDMTVKGIYNAAANKNAADWMLTQVPWRTTGAPAELVLKAEGAKKRTHASSKLLVTLNRAVRGERVPGSTIDVVGRVYPKEAQELKDLIPRLQAGEGTASAVQSLTKKAKLLHDLDLKELKLAINARARAREKAMTPNYGEATIMHPAFQGKMFTGPDAKETVKTLRDALEPKQIAGLKEINSINGLVRYFKLAGDASVMGIQLAIGAFDSPRSYRISSQAFVQALFSEEFHAKLLDNNRDVLVRHPDLITTLSGTEFTEAFQRSGLMRKGPLKFGGVVLGPFQRGFEAALDAYGIEAAKALEHIAKTPQDIQAIDQYLNEMRGLTSSARLGVSYNWRGLETASLLAPRYNRAIASYLADVFEGFAKVGHSGIRARKARNSLIKMTAGITGLWIMLGLALGKNEDEIRDSITRGVFTYNIGGVNIGPGTKMRSVFNLIKNSAKDPEALLQMSMDNPGLRFVRGNLAPVLGTSVNLLLGTNYIGEPVRDNFSNFNRHVLIGNFLPIWVENVLYEGGTVSQRALRGSGEFFGGRAYQETDWQTANIWKDRYAALDYGMKYADLNNAQRGDLRRKYPDLAELEKAAREAFKGDPAEEFYKTESQRLKDIRNDRLEKAAQALTKGDFTKYDYDKERSYIRPYYSGGREVLFSMRESNMSPYEQRQMEKYLDSRKPEDIALGEYQAFYGETIEKADLPKDWDLINSEVEQFLSRYSPKISAYITDHKDDWIKDLPPEARKIEEKRAKGIPDESWWEDYRGTSKKAPTIKRPGALPAPEKKKPWETQGSIKIKRF